VAQPAPIVFGPWFRLKASAIATTRQFDKDVAVHLPAGATIGMMDGIDCRFPEKPNQLVRITWDGSVCMMFLVDVVEKGEPLS
jgi:hypothetical protein